MIEEIRNIKSGKRQLRQFGITIGVALALLGGLLFWRKHDNYFYFFIFSAAMLFLGLIAPVILKPLQKTWMSLAIVIGWFVTRVILAVLFYLVVTPIGLMTRLFGKHHLDLKFNRTADSYWIAREPAKIDKRSYENQF